MRNSESGLSATSASSAKRCWAWLCAPVTTVSPTLTGAPAVSCTRSVPRSAATSPTASSIFPAGCPNAAPAASRHRTSAQSRSKDRVRKLIKALLFEFIAQLQRAHVARILVELEVGAVARVLVFRAHAPVGADQVERAQIRACIVVVPRDAEQRHGGLVVAIGVTDARVERPERRRGNGDVDARAPDAASEIVAILTVVLVADKDRSIQHRLPGGQPYLPVACGK